MAPFHVVATDVKNVTGTPLGDILRGGPEANALDGGEGNDVLYGGAGDDYLDPGAGTDQQTHGENGTDTCVGFGVTARTGCEK